MDVTIIRSTGAQEQVRIGTYGELGPLLGADVCDTVNLRDGRFMYVDDLGYQKQLPVNAVATALYHRVCKPGTTHQILGDVAILRDEDDLCD